jgi:hypothetical protein
MPLTKIQSLGITDGTIVNADINASAAITLAKLSGVNDAKAWVNFNGTGTVAIAESFNVSSITDNGTGLYTVNFTTAMPDDDYAAAVGANIDNSNNDVRRNCRIISINSSNLSVVTGANTNSDSKEDFAIVTVMIFR